MRSDWPCQRMLSWSSVRIKHRATNHNQKPPQRPRRSRATTKPKTHHGDTEKNRRKPVAPRRRGEEFNFDEEFAQKTRKVGISNTEEHAGMPKLRPYRRG